MKIVITGATALFMKEYISMLEKSNCEIIALTRDLNKAFNQKNVTWEKFDLLNKNEKFFFFKNADIVIHAAALSNSYNYNDYLNTNYIPTCLIVDTVKKYDVKHFYYISSIVATPHGGHYGSSKYKSEQYIKENLKNYTIIRPAQLYGHSEKSPIETLIRSVNKKKIIFAPVCDHKGLRPLLYKELSEILYSTTVEKKYASSIIQITGPQSFSYRSLIKHIAGTLSKKVIIIPIPRFVMMMAYFILKRVPVKIAIFPDQIIRFYYQPIEIEPTILTHKKLSRFIKDNYAKQ
ncbi:MAG: NAD-dependent epimerase/dehydratase family protein [Prolixibacteraceae bacterium]|nr:NAD-dependent epimerase/dehydratase family protein [Prolixibacteraceae bacterium]